MKRLALLVMLVMLGLLTASLAFAGQPPSLTKISLQAGKNPEGIAVNPVTHKAYVITENTAEGDDQKAIFVLDNNVINAKSAPKKLELPFGTTTHQPTVVPIPNENEYIAIDSTRNLIYVATRFHAEQDEPPDTDDDSGGGEVDAPGGVNPPELAPVTALEPVTVTLGTLTVIDGNTDTVIATWYFDPGIEPEGVAVDSVNSVVYVGAKAPEGEASDDDTCSSGTPIPDVGEPGDVECWTAGNTYAFFINPADTTEPIKYLKAIPAGDDPESVVFDPVNRLVYAANEDDGTVTIATAVEPDGSGGDLLTDFPQPLVPYSLQVFLYPNPLACVENKFEADKMAAGGGSVFITDDRSRVAKITGIAVVGMFDIPGATQCENIPNSDGGGANTANNIAYMQKDDKGLLYVVSEQNTVAILDPVTLDLKATITIPGAVHLDAIAVDGAANRVWITDEDLNAVFMLHGACANGTGTCTK
jgi:DNA-binding beta-propeller fold protein YncE